MNRRKLLLTAASAAGVATAGAFWWPNRWKYIVIHHSAGEFGTIEFLQRVHRDRQAGDPIDAIPYHTGNFEEKGVPEKQLGELVSLTKELMSKHSIRAQNVIFHGKIEGESTQCPGRHFPFDKFRRAIV